MGQAAKAKAAQRDAWIASLSADENVAREAAENLLRGFIIPERSTGMCYRMTYVLHLYLAQKGVPSTPVVGWVTDGRDDIAISHAWVEVNGKKIDLTLGIVDPAKGSLVGEVLILGRPVNAGAQHHYFLNKEQKHLDADALLASHPTSRFILEHKNDEHEEMKARATDANEMREWLDDAPDGWTFERLAAFVEGRNPRRM